VLQAEHNLLIRLKAFPSVTNLRYVVDSQRLVCRHLAPLAARVDTRMAERWTARADTYAQLQRLLRPIGGLVGRGGFAAAEGATAVGRVKMLQRDTIIEPRVLAGFHLLFDRLDDRIAEVIEDGIDRGAFFQRVTLPRLVEGHGGLIAPVRVRFAPVDRAANHELMSMVRERLRPASAIAHATPGVTRVDLHTALVHRPPPVAPPQL
jgi:hypothetical protein